MNEWHLVKVALHGCRLTASSGGLPLAEWLPSVRFISAKGNPPDDASDRRRSPRPSTLPPVCLKADSTSNHGPKASPAGGPLAQIKRTAGSHCAKGPPAGEAETHHSARLSIPCRSEVLRMIQQ